MTNKRRNRTYSISQAASLLGISVARVSQNVRLGIIRVERRRGRIVVPEREIVRLLDDTESVLPASPPDANSDALARYVDVPTDALVEIVRYGCADPLADDAPPDGVTDADLAAQTCASCRAPYACLALEFRIEGQATVGVWGGLAEDDRRALFAAWDADQATTEIEGSA